MEKIQQVWVRICALDSVPTDKTLDITVNSQRLILTRCGDEAYIYQGFCTHMLFPLAGSQVGECILTCKLHHSRFDVRDGSVVEWATYPPLQDSSLDEIRQRKGLRPYETRVVDGDVYIAWPTDQPEKVRVRVDVKTR